MPIVPSAGKAAKPQGVGPVTILLLAVWIGLIAGSLDVGLMVANRLIDGDFYRLSEHFPWVIPLGVTAVVLLPAAVLSLMARLLRRAVPLTLTMALLSFVGFLDVCARLPLSVWGSLLLSGGLAVQSARLVVPRRGEFLKLVSRTTPPFIGLLLAIPAVMIGARAWSERRAAASLPSPPHAARNVLLIVWDTVRASNLSLHGYSRRTTPNLQQLAGRGVRFDLATATSSWTLPSHASLFTGRWPHEVGVDWKSPLGTEAPTLAEYLGAHGYDTAGFVANLDYCSRETGVARGFVHYEDYPLDPWEALTRYVALGRRIDFLNWACVLELLLGRISGHSFDLLPRSSEHVKDGKEVDRSFFRWLTWQRPRGRPFFAYLNYNDAHTPYEVPDRSTPGFGLRPRSCLERLTLHRWNVTDKFRLSYRDIQMANDIYDDSITFLDRRLESVLSELERRGVLDNTLVIVTSDHGEHLGDHLLFFHGCSLYRQLVQVPLVIVEPSTVPAHRVVTDPVSLRDVPSTVVDLLGLRRNAPFPGRSLARFWGRGGDRPASDLEEPLFMETGKPLLLTNQGREPAARGSMTSLIGWGMHYIRAGDGHEELFNLASDPDERSDLAQSATSQDILTRCRNNLSSMLQDRRPPKAGRGG